ncbi:MAG: amidohydrolase family protein [bacterium]
MQVRHLLLPALIVSLCAGCPGPVASQPQRRHPWLEDPLFHSVAARLDSVRAIDNHTHLWWKCDLDPSALTEPEWWIWVPEFARGLTEEFGMSVNPAGMDAAVKTAEAERARLIQELGPHRYWLRHLDKTQTALALVNTSSSDGSDGDRLRWVPYASVLLYPLAADTLMTRSPNHKAIISEWWQDLLMTDLKEAGLDTVPRDFEGYVRFVDQTLARWKQQGAVAVKFLDALLRTLVFADVPQERARALYAKGLDTPLSRDEYLALQDYLTRHIFLECGRLKLPVHIHSSEGPPPFMRLHDCDVRNLDDVLTDVRFFDTQFVLIHGGYPLVEAAAYLGLKPNVWVDISAMPFLVPTPDFAAILRKYLLYCPNKVLFATDAGGKEWVGGADVMHAALSRLTREALYLALAGLVRDGLLDPDRAVQLGEGVLHGNAERLYGFSGKKAAVKQ